MDDLLVTIVFGLPLVVIVLLVIRLIVGGGAYVSKSRRQMFDSEKESLDHKIKMVEQEIRALDRQIADFRNHE